MTDISSIDVNSSLETLMVLYDLYAPDKVHGQPIVINFGCGIYADSDDIGFARKFANGIREQINADIADVEQSNSKVIITPNL